MKTGFAKSISVGMLVKKHYCHKCGARLCRHSDIKTVSPQDPEWKKYSRIGHIRRVPIGEIEVTEYRFKCPNCENMIEYDEQVLIRKIQKKKKSKTLSEADLMAERAWAQAVQTRSTKIWSVIMQIIAALLIAAWLYYVIKNGEFKMQFYS